MNAAKIVIYKISHAGAKNQSGGAKGGFERL
jgi:hypothetical protein